MVDEEYPYLCNNCGTGLTENSRCGMKCYSCGNSGNMVEVASMNRLEKNSSNILNEVQNHLREWKGPFAFQFDHHFMAGAF